MFSTCNKLKPCLLLDLGKSQMFHNQEHKFFFMKYNVKFVVQITKLHVSGQQSDDLEEMCQQSGMRKDSVIFLNLKLCFCFPAL